VSPWPRPAHALCASEHALRGAPQALQQRQQHGLVARALQARAAGRRAGRPRARQRRRGARVRGEQRVQPAQRQRQPAARVKVGQQVLQQLVRDAVAVRRAARQAASGAAC